LRFRAIIQTTSGVPPSAGTRGRNGLPTNRFKPQLCDRMSPMPEAAYSSIMTEAVAVFHDVESFQAAIDDLLPAGFDHADIASARASSISLIENTLSISFVGPRR